MLLWYYTKLTNVSSIVKLTRKLIPFFPMELFGFAFFLFICLPVKYKNFFVVQLPI